MSVRHYADVNANANANACADFGVIQQLVGRLPSSDMHSKLLNI